MNEPILHSTVEEYPEYPGETYAQPLAGLRVSWGAILAGAVAFIAVSTILFALAAAITLTATNATLASLKGTLVTLWICAIVTTLIGAFFGGGLAGYLPGNRSTIVGGAHGFLAWAVAFIIMSAAAVGVLGGITRATTNAALSTANAMAQTAGSAVGGIAGGPMTLDRKATDLLESLGYTPPEASAMVAEAKAKLRQDMQGGVGLPTGNATQKARSGIDAMIDWSAGLTWAWFGTWAVSAVLAIAGAIAGAKRLRPRLREVPMVEHHDVIATPGTPAIQPS